MAKILSVSNGPPFIFQVASQLGELTVRSEAHKMAEDRAKELKDQARAAWEAMSERVLADIDKGDFEYNKGVVKMNKIHAACSLARNASHFHAFRTQRRRRDTIGVQPNSVSRRRTHNGSRKKVDSANKSKTLPHRPVSKKKPHNFTLCLNKNVPCAKKAGRVMKSMTSYPDRTQYSNCPVISKPERPLAGDQEIPITFIDKPTTTVTLKTKTKRK